VSGTGNPGAVTGVNGSGTLLVTAAGSASSNAVSANVGGQITTISAVDGLSCAAGDSLVVHRIGSTWIAVARARTTAPLTPPPSPKPPPTTTGTKVFTPVETRSYRTSVHVGWRTDNTSVYQGQYGGQGNHVGCAFYGGAPRSLAGATVVAASIYVQRISGGVYAAQSTTMWLLSESSRPGGAPTRQISTSGPHLAVGASVNGSSIPTSWAQAIVDGTAGGLGFYASSGSPYVRFAGRGDWSPAFSLIITWRR
jgi:hypothetical protein